jgi:hypothetical protein
MKSINFLNYKHQILFFILSIFGFNPFITYSKKQKINYRNLIFSIFYIAVGLFLIGFLNFLPIHFSDISYILLVTLGFIFLLLPVLNIYLNQIYLNAIENSEEIIYINANSSSSI